MKLIIYTLFSALLFGCSPSQETSTNEAPITDPFMLVENAQHLEYLTTAFYTDGGSYGWVFNTDKDKQLIVFLPIKRDDNYNRVNVFDSSQAVQLTLNRYFKNDELVLLAPKSDAEFRLIKLIAESARKDQSEEHKLILSNLIKIICERNFTWIRNVKTNSNQRVDLTRPKATR